MDYDEEAKKIINVCRYNICVFERIGVLSKRDYDRIQKQKLLCPKICPKYQFSTNNSDDYDEQFYPVD